MINIFTINCSSISNESNSTAEKSNINKKIFYNYKIFNISFVYFKERGSKLKLN